MAGALIISNDTADTFAIAETACRRVLEEGFNISSQQVESFKYTDTFDEAHWKTREEITGMKFSTSNPLQKIADATRWVITQPSAPEVIVLMTDAPEAGTRTRSGGVHHSFAQTNSFLDVIRQKWPSVPVIVVTDDDDTKDLEKVDNYVLIKPIAGKLEMAKRFISALNESMPESRRMKQNDIMALTAKIDANASIALADGPDDAALALPGKKPFSPAMQEFADNIAAPSLDKILQRHGLGYNHALREDLLEGQVVAVEEFSRMLKVRKTLPNPRGK